MKARNWGMSQWTRNLITSGLEDRLDVQVLRKIMMINIISAIGVLNLVPLGVLAFLQGNSAAGCFDMGAAAIIMSNLFYLRRSGRYNFVSVVGVFFVGGLFLYLFLTGGSYHTGYLWYFTFPLIASFILGSKRGAMATLILFSAALVFFLWGIPMQGFAAYTTDFKIKFIASFLIVFGYAFLFEHLREKTEEKLAERNDALEESLLGVQEAEVALRRARDRLEERVKERTAELTAAYEQVKQQDQRVKERTAELSATNKQLKQEIQERSTVEHALRESEQRLKAMLDSLLTGIVVIEADTHTIVDVNPVAAELLGAPKEKIVGRQCCSFICTAEKGQCPVTDLGQTINRSESLLINKWGGRIPVLKTVIPIVLNGRKHIIDSFVDITEQKRAKEALSLSEERVRKINEALSEGLTEVFEALNRISSGDPSVRIPETSQLESIAKLKHMVNLTAENLGEIVDLSHEFAMGLAEHFDALHRVSGGDLRARVSGSSQVELLESLKKVTNEMIEHVSTEIRERKRAEEALRKAIDEAESANRAKGEFLANMSHEIRTPMNAIMGMTHLVLDSQLNKEQREYLETVRVASESLLTLLNDILDFSKIEAGALELEDIDFDLRTTLESAVELLAVKAEQAGLELACHIRPDVPTALVGDPVRLRQIIVNLTGNAIKFTEQGEVTVSVITQEEDDASVFLHFMISDTGIGISPGQSDAIFDSFKQADGSTKRKYGGTGLGLAISKQLTEMMGGRIWVESELGKGSVFHFTACFGFSKSEGAEALRIRNLDLAGIPVLIVDDNATNRLVLQEMTSSWGLEPSEAKDEEEAVSKIESALESGMPYQVVLLDSRLSRIDGFEVAKRLKESPYGEDLRIILLTSMGSKGDAAQCAKFGVSAYLVKPVKQSDLLDAILMALGYPADEKVPLITRYTIEEARKRLRILVVEDNVVNQKVASAMLEKRGHGVVIASNGREALGFLDKENFDLILMDVQMPEMDGFEATRLIRQREKEDGGQIPIVAMTAHAMKGDRERCLEAGMDDYVSKPIRDANLFSVIQKLVKGLENKKQVRRLRHLEHINPADQGVFDLSEAMRAVDGDQDLFKEIASLFLASAADNMAKIRAAISERDARVVEHAAHSIKGSVANFGAKRAFDVACRLERIGKEGKLKEAESAHLELVKELQALETAMEAAIAG
jgi:two-component system sensor histidine kinase/response regulator